MRRCAPRTFLIEHSICCIWKGICLLSETVEGSGLVRLVPLGGLGEIGKNMMFIEYIDDNIHDSLIIDTGIMFPENDMLGVDYIIPDFNYIMDKLDTIQGVLITHGHEDHTGAIAHVMEHVQAPIYATPMTRALLETKLRGEGLIDSTTLVTVQAGDVLRMGCFLVEPFHQCHSIPDSLGLGITTPIGLLVHTGDFKIDHTPVDGWPNDFGKLAEFGQRGVLALMSDSTNITVPGWTPTEVMIDNALDNIFQQAEGRILIATFASLISRVQQVANATQRYGRKMAVTGYSMTQNTQLARDLGYLNIPDSMIVDIGDTKNLPNNEVVIVTTGTQGEPRAGLGRLSRGSHRYLDVDPDDTIIMSSHPIPGNEEMVYRTMNKLIQRGANVVYDPIASVHVSGHAAHEELKFMYNMLRPKFFIPVHGELRHLHAHAKMAMSLGHQREDIAVVENGNIIDIASDFLALGERVPGGYVFVDGAGVGDVGPEVLRDREILGNHGFVIVNVTLDRDTRQIIGQPELISRGFVYLREARELIAAAEDTVKDTVAANGFGSVRNLKQDIEKRLERFFYTETRRRPMIFASVREV